MIKIPKPDFNSIWTVKFQMFKLDLAKAEETEIITLLAYEMSAIVQ